MEELRWVLLGLGVALVAGVYLWSRNMLGRSQGAELKPIDRTEPQLSDSEELLDQEPTSSPAEPGQQIPQGVPVGRATADRVVAIRFVPRNQTLNADQVVLALREAGLRHGRYGIFHQPPTDSTSGESLFSVASLTEPGSFDLTKLNETMIPGMSFFIVLPGSGDPVARFDAMVAAARSLAVALDAELFDETGSSWSIQRERYVREEVIEYRHQHGQL